MEMTIIADMPTRKLGRTGLKVSALCLGTMTFGWSADEATSFALMDAAVDGGINFFDTADYYTRWLPGHVGGEAETILGKWLKRQPRRDFVIATKVAGRMWDGPNGEGLSRAHIIQAVEDSLRRLQTDYIDLYQMHWPDSGTPLDETLSAFDALVRAGKVRYLGASNTPAWLLMKALWISDIHGYARIDCLQPHYSLLHRAEYEHELRAACRDQQLGVIPYSPLAAGFLTGKYSRSQRHPDSARGSKIVQRLLADDQAFAALDAVERIAVIHGVPVAPIALAWLLADDTITAPILGPRTVDQLTEVIGAINVRLTHAEIEALNHVTEKF